MTNNIDNLAKTMVNTQIPELLPSREKAVQNWNGRKIDAELEKLIPLFQSIDQATQEVLTKDITEIMGRYLDITEQEIAQLETSPQALDSRENFEKYRDILLKNTNFLADFSPQLLMRFLDKLCEESKKFSLPGLRYSLSREDEGLALALIACFEQTPVKVDELPANQLIDILVLSVKNDKLGLVTHIEKLFIENKGKRFHDLSAQQFVDLLRWCVDKSFKDEVQRYLVALDAENQAFLQWTGDQLVDLLACSNHLFHLPTLHYTADGCYQYLFSKVIQELFQNEDKKLQECSEWSRSTLSDLCKQIVGLPYPKDDFYTAFEKYYEKIKKSVRIPQGETKIENFNTLPTTLKKVNVGFNNSIINFLYVR